MKINELCKINREQLGLTIKEFSSSINIDANLYSKFEDGEYNFSKEIMEIIVKSLYIEEDDLSFYETFKGVDDITNISLKVIEKCEMGE